jgi:hypothetical protein
MGSSQYAPSGLMRSGQFLSLVLLCCFTYINFNGCEWDALTSAYASDGGHLEVLQRALDNGCSLDYRYCSHGTHFENLHVPQWAPEKGYFWDLVI